MIGSSRDDAGKGQTCTLTAMRGLVFLGIAQRLGRRTIRRRPIRVVVGFGPGAVADVILRVLTARMSQSLGQQLVVENRPGAGSSLGAEYVARAPKDGYTLLMCTVAQTINPAMNNLSFDFGKDLAPITLVANAPQMLVAHPSLPANNIRGADCAGEVAARRRAICLVRRGHHEPPVGGAAQQHRPASSSSKFPIPAARRA